MKKNSAIKKLVPMVFGALFLDALFKDPRKFHPVSIYGSYLKKLEDLLYSDSYFASAMYLIFGVIFLLPVTLVATPLISAVSLFFVISRKQLHSVARQIGGEVLIGELDEARHDIKALVGRATEQLGKEDLIKAIIESVAENTLDSTIGPIFFAVLFGPAGAVFYRAVNTMDSMVGYKTEKYKRFGFFPAKLDDVLNYLPGRLTFVVAILLSRTVRRRRREIVYCAKKHPSPNAGLLESLFASELEVKLGGDTDYKTYISQRGVMDFGPLPKCSDIEKAIYFSNQLVFITAAVLIVLKKIINFSRSEHD